MKGKSNRYRCWGLISHWRGALLKAVSRFSDRRISLAIWLTSIGSSVKIHFEPPPSPMAGADSPEPYRAHHFPNDDRHRCGCGGLAGHFAGRPDRTGPRSPADAGDGAGVPQGVDGTNHWSVIVPGTRGRRRALRVRYATRAWNGSTPHHSHCDRRSTTPPVRAAPVALA